MTKQPDTEPKSNWLVRVEKTVIVDVLCVNCTREEARENPFAFAIDEQDCELTDWEVLSVSEDV